MVACQKGKRTDRYEDGRDKQLARAVLVLAVNAVIEEANCKSFAEDARESGAFTAPWRGRKVKLVWNSTPPTAVQKVSVAISMLRRQWHQDETQHLEIGETVKREVKLLLICSS
ncbi:hypothetical protein TcWFU_002699 [Taenia crassiceps]|uniref:Uncharacterized protein n=1 Tax=Taenia crassiceps TaxID=6207 RepID=A0ABR4QAR1_9CEST